MSKRRRPGRDKKARPGRGGLRRRIFRRDMQAFLFALFAGLDRGLEARTAVEADPFPAEVQRGLPLAARPTDAADPGAIVFLGPGRLDAGQVRAGRDPGMILDASQLITEISVYCFSWENWARPKEEVDNLFAMANHYFERWPEFVQNNIRVVISGTRQRVPAESLVKMETIQRETAHCTGLTLNLCCNYSGRMEIVDAVARGARTEEEITAALYQDLPEPDLIIRTGGFQRLSNFLLWQGAYAELYFTETLFPDFSLGEFRHAVRRYGATARKHGGVG